jgi:hypothetical protein
MTLIVRMTIVESTTMNEFDKFLTSPKVVKEFNGSSSFRRIGSFRRIFNPAQFIPAHI